MDNSVIDYLLHASVAVIGGTGLVGLLIFRGGRKMSIAVMSAIGFIAAGAYFILKGLFEGLQWFVIMEDWASIITSGTATLSAALYLLSQWRPSLRKEAYLSFLVIYKVIWVGIGILAAISFWYFARYPYENRDLLAGVLLFEQIIFAVIILNGVYIGKRIGGGLIAIMKQDPPSEPDRMLATRIAVSGSISIVSWYLSLAIKKGVFIPFGLVSFTIIYIGLIAAIVALNLIIESLRRAIYAKPGTS